jgi:uncharacterized cupredoxin-like copper-binding protein
VELVITDAGFSPAEFCAQPGTEVRIVVRNDTKSAHALEFDIPGSTPTLGKELNPGESAEMTIVTPSKPGQYPFYSPIGDERSKGFSGMLVVTNPGAVHPQPIKPPGRAKPKGR